jgi:hypothetical protein
LTLLQIISAEDNPDLPALTFRFWVLGTGLATFGTSERSLLSVLGVQVVAGSVLSEIYFWKPQNAIVSSLFQLIISYVLGNAVSLQFTSLCTSCSISYEDALCHAFDRDLALRQSRAIQYQGAHVYHHYGVHCVNDSHCHRYNSNTGSVLWCDFEPWSGNLSNLRVAGATNKLSPLIWN